MWQTARHVRSDLTWLCCFQKHNCAFCRLILPMVISSGHSPLPFYFHLLCRSVCILQVHYALMVLLNLMPGWQWISLCSFILHWPLGGCRNQTMTNMSYKFHHLGNPLWLTLLTLIDRWNSLLSKTCSSFVLSFLCFHECALTQTTATVFIQVSSPEVVCHRLTVHMWSLVLIMKHLYVFTLYMLMSFFE